MMHFLLLFIRIRFTRGRGSAQCGGCCGREALRNWRQHAARSVFDKTIDVMLGSVNTCGDLKHVCDAQEGLLGVSIGHDL